MFTKLLSMLIYYKHNVHVLHWKTCGANFQPNHEFLGGLYDEMNTHIDQIGELGLQAGEDPVSLQEALSVLDKDSASFVGINPKESYNEEVTFTQVITMFKDIIGEIVFIEKNNELNEAQKNDLAAMEGWYRLRAEYLIPRRLIK